MIPGSKSLNPHELAHKGVKDFGTRPRYEHKSGASASRYANIGGMRIVGVLSAEQSAGITKSLAKKSKPT